VVVVGVGSNRGDSLGYARAGIERLRAFAVGEFRCSSLWRTSPVDCPPEADDFINAVVALEAVCGRTPQALLGAVKGNEREFGREPNPARNAPRELDLDLLLFDALTRQDEQLTLPHPRAATRRFVLAPAAEIIPQLVWPGMGRTIATLLADLADEASVQRLDAS
jgi:2-amino-4-hydroxy-6-hydroxymethyldihydropteridine diphosphokinase